MPKVIVDLAALQFIPDNYTRTFVSPEILESLAAHLRGIDIELGLQSTTQLQFGTATDQQKQYADIGTVPTDGPFATVVGSGATEQLQILSPFKQFNNKRVKSNTTFTWAHDGTVIYFPDQGLWAAALSMSVNSSSTGVEWTITPYFGNVAIDSARKQFRTSNLGDPVGVTIPVRGTIATLGSPPPNPPDISRSFFVEAAHDSLQAQTLTIKTAWIGLNFVDTIGP